MTVGADRRRATLIGFGAVPLWALLAPLTVAAGTVPPFLMTGLAFAVAASMGFLIQAARGAPLAACLARRPAAWLAGAGGLFGFHALYFLALRLAPPVEAGLIVYLWPLFIVLFSALLPGARLRPRHVLGALMGLLGAALLIARDGLALGGFGAGYLVALAAAFVWTGYSLLNAREGAGAGSAAVVGYCAATSLLALLCHALFEPTVWPSGAGWLAVLGLGLGPVGAAFFLWDHGTRHGDVRALGASAYLAPLLSTLILVAFGQGEPGWRLAAACLLIVGGAALASGDVLRRRGPVPPQPAGAVARIDGRPATPSNHPASRGRPSRQGSSAKRKSR